jgi:transcriptional antiterminator RfaH
MIRWYVVYTHQGAERVAEGHLQRQGFQTYLPICRKITRHARRVAKITMPLFPRYLFIAVDTATQRWRAINSTFGVKQIISMGERPSAVPDGVVDEIKAREAAEGLIEIAPKSPFKTGETVHIIGGPLADQVGHFQRLNEKDRASVLLDMLGRKIEVQVPLQTVRAYA